jgi:chemotaxis protein CheX
MPTEQANGQPHPAPAQGAAAPAPTAATAATAKLVVHFVRSIQEVLATMAGMTVTVGKPTVKVSPATSYDVSGLIGFSGDFVGSMVLSFKEATAEKLVAAFAGAPIPAGSADFADAVGELANMIAGAAKKSFGSETSITVPSVILGHGHVVARLQDVPCLIIPCQSPAGEFAVEVCIKPQKATAPAAAKE